MTRNPFFPKFQDLPAELPIFPLSGAVVLPGVQLPLNIFEPRYLCLVNDALAAEHLIGMIQPIGDTEVEEHPSLHRVGCAGRITSYSETDDGRIQLVLTGVCRFEARRELDPRKGYRRVVPGWEPFAIDYQEPESRLTDRGTLYASLRAFASQHGGQIPWDEVKSMSDLVLINLLCTHLPLEPEDKQALIATVDLRQRAELLRGLMDMSSATPIQTAEHRH